MGIGTGPVESLGVSFWRGRRVLLTGHTGFKGAWAARWLAGLGAQVTGLALPPSTSPNLSDLLGTGHLAASHLVDLRDLPGVKAVVRGADPEVVLHMAAQPLVRLSYDDPVGTFGSNVMGTVHLLDALRRLAGPLAIVVVTSDKVYANDGSGRAYGEADPLGGHDPYSASKAATEIVVEAFRRSYFSAAGVALVTARGGNVIGGGDYSADRLVPDIVRALMAGQRPQLRNPAATRPWQHVLDCLDGYFAYAAACADGRPLPPALNFGPPADAGAVTVADLTRQMLSAFGQDAGYDLDDADTPAEMPKLAIDPTLAGQTLGWHPCLTTEATIDLTARWYSAHAAGADMARITDRQIEAYKEIRA